MHNTLFELSNGDLLILRTVSGEMLPGALLFNAVFVADVATRCVFKVKGNQTRPLDPDDLVHATMYSSVLALVGARILTAEHEIHEDFRSRLEQWPSHYKYTDWSPTNTYYTTAYDSNTLNAQEEINELPLPLKTK